MALHRGYNYFSPDPGLWEREHCRVCGTECNVDRDVEGYRSYAQAMSGKKSKFDRYTCPFSDEEWHEQAIRLMKEAEATESKRVKALIEQDLAELIKENL